MRSISEYKEYLSDYLTNYHNITDLKTFFHCLNPNHMDNNPSMMFTDKYYICKCFSCGVSYDIFDLVGIDYDLHDFKDKLKKVRELYSEYIPKKINSKKIDDKLFDYSNYFRKCIKDIDKSDYLEKRGIVSTLIKKYSIGFDLNKNLIVFPINNHCYFARSTIDKRKLKSKGKSDIWNKQYLINSHQNDLVYVVESIIDALSLETVNPSIKVISINGVTNINKLIKAIKDSNFIGTIVIAFDNDESGKYARDELKRLLYKINVPFFAPNLIPDFSKYNFFCKDLNEALIFDQDLLCRKVNYYHKCYLEALRKREMDNGNEL